MVRSGRDKEIHDNMVKTRADALKNQGYNVQAHIDGYDTPRLVGGLIPDIIAIGNNEKIIVEVETCDSYHLEHTREQYEAFSSESGSKFHVVIPTRCLEQAKAKANEWNIRIDQWWKDDGV